MCYIQIKAGKMSQELTAEEAKTIRDFLLSEEHQLPAVVLSFAKILDAMIENR